MPTRSNPLNVDSDNVYSTSMTTTSCIESDRSAPWLSPIRFWRGQGMPEMFELLTVAMCLVRVVYFKSLAPQILWVQNLQVTLDSFM